MAKSDHSDHIQELLLEWKAASPLPSPVQLYKLGLILATLSTSSSIAQNEDKLQVKSDEFIVSYQKYLLALPENYCPQLFASLVDSLTSLLQKYQKPSSTSPPITTPDVSEALGSLVQLYNHSNLAAATCAKDWSCIERLSVLCDCYYHHSSNQSIRRCVLSITSHFVRQTTHRTFFESNSESVVPVLHWIQQSTNINDSSKGIWDDVVVFMDQQDSQWRESILQQWNSNSDDASQPYFSYIQSLLSSDKSSQAVTTRKASSREIPIWNTSRTQSRPLSSTRKSPEQEIQDRIDQVRSILPHLGEGFIETALSCFQGSVEHTVSTLMDDASHWPVTLQRTDRSLPRRLIKNTPQEDVEAKAITKAIIQANDQQAELEARMLELVIEPPGDSPNTEVRTTFMNEYDDDYDDQYDDLDGVVTGNVDVELYDSNNNYDAIRSYNRTLKHVEAEQQFWNESRNTNYAPSPAIESEGMNVDGRKYRGPDLMRGGRTPGGRGAGAGRNSRNNPPDTSTSKPTTMNSAEQNGDSKAIASKPNPRQKARIMEKRRDQQKKAQMKRTGA